MPALDLPLLGWVVVVASALLIGIAKTSVGGLGALAVAGFALFLPAKESTAAVLLLLIVGDIVAVSTYRRTADWRMLRRLLPAVLPGIVLGALLMLVIDDRTMTILIAVCILVLVGVQVIARRLSRAAEQHPPEHPHPVATIGTGVAAGFTTMIANAAGPVMALYLLAARVDKMRFVGTSAWFFFVVNVSKVPFSAGLGLFPATTLTLTLVLAPIVLVGTYLGRRLLFAIGQRTFERLVVAASLLGGVLLLVSGVLAPA